MDIKIDISGTLGNIATAYDLTASQTKSMSRDMVYFICQRIYEEWDMLASNELRSTREIYRRGLLKPEVKAGVGSMVTGAISLVGQLQLMMEDGAPPFDMKKGMKGAKNVKFKKGGGWYATIPLRFGVPGALAENEAFAGKMPKAVYNVAKFLDAYKSKYRHVIPDNNNFFYGKSLKKEVIVHPHNIPKKSEGHGDFAEYEHKHSIFEGMVRKEDTPGNKKSSQYMTFRRISDMTDSNAFIHPGFTALGFAEKAVSRVDIDIITENVAGNFLESLGF